MFRIPLLESILPYFFLDKKVAKNQGFIKFCGKSASIQAGPLIMARLFKYLV
jgi:hypothetical protein